MKNLLLLSTAAVTLLAVGCRKIESDGEPIIINNGGGTGGGTNTGQVITLRGTITSDTVLRKANTYILQGPVVMDNNKTMTIEAGTVIKGAYSGSDVGFLCITRGSKIVARGTASEPIVFTSSSNNPQSGDWGGIVLCGKAAVNTSLNGVNGLIAVEGLQGLTAAQSTAGSGDAVAPAPVNDDSSGVLSYVRIEYAGYAFQPDKELNSLTLAAVGNKTQIDHIQVAYAKDDAYEWFGGTVNCKYLIAYKTQDDDFDTDNGYSGNVQFGLIVRDSSIADISKSEAFESDNNSGGTTATPVTKAVFSNITAIGPRAALNNVGNSLFLAGAQIRRNSSISIYNSVIMGWPIGVLIDASLGRPTDNNITDSTLRIRYTTLAGNNIPVKYSASAGSPTGATDASITAWFTNSPGNTIITNTYDAKLIQPFNYQQLDPTPFAGSNGYAPIVSGANFSEPMVNNSFFTPVTFRGAIAPAGAESNWWKGWARYNF